MTKKVIMVGTPLPVLLHARMRAHLAKTKGVKGQPQTLKELAVMCIERSMGVIDALGDDAVKAFVPKKARVTPAAPVRAAAAPMHAPTTTAGLREELEAVSSLTAHLKGRGGQGFAVRLQDNELWVHVPEHALVAPNTIPEEWAGRTVRRAAKTSDLTGKS